MHCRLNCHYSSVQKDTTFQYEKQYHQTFMNTFIGFLKRSIENI